MYLEDRKGFPARRERPCAPVLGLTPVSAGSTMNKNILVPGERVLLELSRPKLIALEERGTDASGQHVSERRYHLLSESPRLLLTDLRLLMLNAGGLLTFEAVYDLPFLRSYLANLRRWNDLAEGRMAQVEQNEGAVARWIRSRGEERRFGIMDSLYVVAWAERPKGLLGPKGYSLLTLCHFRPFSAQREEALEAQERRTPGPLQRERVELEVRKIGCVFSFEPAQLTVHEKDQIDRLVSALSAKTPSMTDYLSGPQGLEVDCGLPPGSTTVLAGYRPPDFDGTTPPTRGPG